MTTTAEYLAVVAVPTTREEAIAALVEYDAIKWGEQERAASARHHAGRTIGLAINALWAHAELADIARPDLKRAAKAALTSSDRAVLRTGG